MKKFFLFISCLSLFLVLLTSTASALQVTPLTNQANLAPCQQAVFSFKVTSEQAGQTAFHLTNTQTSLNYSIPTSVYLNGEAIVDVAVLYPCDAQPTTGLYAFSLVANQGGEQAAGTSYVFLSPASSLAVSLTSEELACSCASTRLVLEMRNTGHKRESGTVLVSSQFPFSIADTGFNLAVGESVSKQIVVDLNCSVAAGVYPVSVAIASQGSNVKYAYSGLSVSQCYASNLIGPRQAVACYGDSVDVEYSLFNNGNFEQDYVVSTTLGSVPFSQFTLEGHSYTPFNVSIPLQSIPYPGTYNFSVSAARGQGFETIPVTLTTILCEGKPVPSIAMEYPVLDVNRTLAVRPGENALSIAIHNPNNFSVYNAVLSLNTFGAISSVFNLNANETRQVSVLITVPENFTNATAILNLESDQGRTARVLQLEKAPNSITGLFVLGTHFISDTYLAFGAIVIVILAALFFYAETQRRDQLIADKEISIHLEKILTKHRRS